MAKVKEMRHDNLKIRGYILFLFLMSSLGLSAQNYHGTTGLLHVPSAETDSAGTFRGNISFLHKEFLPEQLWYYGDGIPFNAPCYSIGITAFRWLELSYTGTIVKTHGGKGNDHPLKYYNEDRHINVRAVPLYEGKWWPGIAIGWDDIGSLKSLKINSAWTTNNFFECLYVAGSKHFDIKGYELGAHLAYRHYPSDKNKDRRGVAGGITLRPAFYRPLRFIAEWDAVGVNVGADVLLWRHLFLQACLVHGHGFMGGISYHYTIKF